MSGLASQLRREPFTAAVEAIGRLKAEEKSHLPLETDRSGDCGRSQEWQPNEYPPHQSSGGTGCPSQESLGGFGFWGEGRLS